MRMRAKVQMLNPISNPPESYSLDTVLSSTIGHSLRIYQPNSVCNLGASLYSCDYPFQFVPYNCLNDHNKSHSERAIEINACKVCELSGNY